MPVTRAHKILLVGTALMLGWAAWGAYRVYYTYAHIPEAYAAWDTGTLLVEFMKAHEGHWPSSWDDLLTVMDSESGQKIVLRGAGAGDMRYAKSLREKIRVDWSFDPTHPDAKNPVTRLDGSPFPIVWEEPNDMVRYYLHARAVRRSSTAPDS